MRKSEDSDHLFSVVMVFALILSAVVSPPRVFAATLVVGKGSNFDYHTVTEALVSAGEGDVIEVVGGGDKFEDEEFPIKIKNGITIRGSEGHPKPEVCASKGSSVFAVENVESATLAGIVISGGSAENGGGVLVKQSTLKIEDCIIRDNEAMARGAGLFISGATVSLFSSYFETNIVSRGTTDFKGVAIESEFSGLSIEGCTFKNNVALESGYTIYCDFFNIVISNSKIEDNECGGVYFLGRDCFINKSEITNSNGGSGLTMFCDTATVSNCRISGNSSRTGGGIECDALQLDVINCIVNGNHSIGPGGGIYCANSDNNNLAHCTFYNNTSASRGGGIYTVAAGVNVQNCIVVNNSPEDVSSGRIGGGYIGYSCLGDGIDPAFPYVDIENIIGNPQFRDAANGDYHLERGSPCIDSGTDTGLTTDFDGNPRPVGAYDMGAFEFPFLRSDIDGDGVVGEKDLLILQSDWKLVTGS